MPTNSPILSFELPPESGRGDVVFSCAAGEFLYTLIIPLLICICKLLFDSEPRLQIATGYGMIGLREICGFSFIKGQGMCLFLSYHIGYVFASGWLAVP